jgi:hypothetical protein
MTDIENVMVTYLKIQTTVFQQINYSMTVDMKTGLWDIILCAVFRNDLDSRYLQQFIIFRLNIKQLLAQHLPFLGYTALPSVRELLDGFREPLFRGLAKCHSWTAARAVSLPLLELCTQLNIVIHAGIFSPQIAGNQL